MRWPLGGNFELPTWFITALITNCDVRTNITQNYQKNRNKTGNITQTKITGIFTTLVMRTIEDQ
jgi:hypothetical protein